MIIEQMGHTDICTTENVYIKNRNRMEEKSCKLGKIDELRLDPVKEDASDLNLNCQVIKMETVGLEPMTSTLPVSRSPN